jgi:hypothetical protein
MRKANYEIVSSTDSLVVIKDVGPWDVYKSVANDAEAIVEELLSGLNGRRLEYIDEAGRQDEILIEDGRFVGFGPGHEDQEKYNLWRDAGVERGRAIASWIAMPEMGEVYQTIDGKRNVTSVEEAEEVFLLHCDEAEYVNREYSPFEFAAHEINSLEDAVDVWAHYNDGIQQGFIENWNERKSFYE